MDSSPSRCPVPRRAVLLARLGKLVLTEPWPFVVDLENSRGMSLAAADGQRLFDWAGYYASKPPGHNHPRPFEPDYARHLVIHPFQ